MYPILNLQKKPFSTSLINFRVANLELPHVYKPHRELSWNEMRNLCVSQEARHLLLKEIIEFRSNNVLKNIPDIEI